MEGTKDLASINTLDLPEAAEGSATPSSPAKSTTRTPALKKVGLTPVTEAELFSFLFPEGLQHPSSASRLFLFARYGPLVHGQMSAALQAAPRIDQAGAQRSDRAGRARGAARAFLIRCEAR